MKMKKSIFIFSCFFMFVFPLFSQDSDFIVSLEVNSEEDIAYIVFENTTTDFITLFSDFRRFDREAITSPGFTFSFYSKQGEGMLVEWPSHLSREYIYENGRMDVGALQTVKFPVWVPLLNRDGIKVICEIRYRYINHTKREFKSLSPVETNPVYISNKAPSKRRIIRIE
jgi:hypothetical protein